MMRSVVTLLSMLLLSIYAIAQPATTPRVETGDKPEDNKRDADEARPETEDATRDVNAITARALASLYGRGVPQNVQEGVRLLRLAAAKGHLDAMFRLGVLLADGKIVGKDSTEAVTLFSMAAEANYAPAMLELGLIYSTGEGVTPDPTKAAGWYRKAADLGNPVGQVNLGFLYQQGRGVEKNDVTAVVLYRKAADQGNASGIHNLAAMLDSGRGLERKNPEEAADLMMTALDRRNEFSRRQMAENSRAWSFEFRQALQRRLADAGFFKGPIDGEFSFTTYDAIAAYVNRTR